MIDVSILLCTWNNSRSLRWTLEAMTRLQVPPELNWEIIVVNNNCSDDTDEVIKDFSKRLPLGGVHEPRQGLSVARNAGLKHCQGQWIIFADDDIEPCPQWLKVYAQAFSEKPSGHYFGGPVESVFLEGKPDPELLWLAPFSVKGLEWGGEERALTKAEMFIGANWACQREILMSVGGFNDHLGLNPELKKMRTGEEKELMLRLNARGLVPWYLPTARIKHLVPGHKIQKAHIMARQEAYGFEQAVNYSESYTKGEKIFGLPRWLFRQRCGLWTKYLFQRLQGNLGYKEYAHLQYLRGLEQGIRDASIQNAVKAGANVYNCGRSKQVLSERN